MQAMARCGLEVLLHGAPCADGSGAALDGAGVDLELLDPVEVELDPTIGCKLAAVEGYGGCGGGLVLFDCHALLHVRQRKSVYRAAGAAGAGLG
jgi:hypothetical protein